MRELSFTLEYFLCSVNKKGDLPALSMEKAGYLIAGGIAELERQGLILREAKDKFSINQPWDDSLPHLKPLYDLIASQKKPKRAAGIAERYMFSFSNKQFNELLSAFRAVLLEVGCVEELTGQGFRKNKTKYPPKPEAVSRIIEKLRAEILEDGTLADETVFLAALLDRSKILRNYFSKVESQRFKNRLKEIRQSEAASPVVKLLEEIDSLITAFVVIVVAH